MIFATNIHEDPSVKRILLTVLPKPKNLYVHKKKHELKNPNPSLIGYSFETFFKVKSCSAKTYMKKFENEFLQAKKTIERIRNKRPEINAYSNDTILFLTKKEINFFLETIRSTKCEHNFSLIKSKNSISFIKKNGKIQQIDFKVFYEIWKNTKVDILKPNLIIIDKESLAKFYESVILKFVSQTKTYLNTKKITIKYIEILILFTNINSQFSLLSHPMRSIEGIKTLSKYLMVLIKSSNKKIDSFKGKILCKPSLAAYQTLATPDFIIGNEIFEIKTSNSILSQDDYLQCLIYLIFSQTEENKLYYGKIEAVNIYYALHDYNVQIKFAQIQNKYIKLQKFFTSKEKEILKNPTEYATKLYRKK